MWGCPQFTIIITTAAILANMLMPAMKYINNGLIISIPRILCLLKQRLKEYSNRFLNEDKGGFLNAVRKLEQL
jgi:hypothetical protein